MMISWWFLWFMFMFMFLVPPIGYGWGYRGWGPPYPRYIQRRRGPQPADSDGTPHHLSWGWGGDFVWLVFLIGAMWVVMAVWSPLWRR
jgi:hypothetical protein